MKLDLPGRPRWCVTDAAAERLFVCIREPSMILIGACRICVLAQWRLPCDGAHGLDSIMPPAYLRRLRRRRSCRGRQPFREVTNVWPIAGPPDVTWFNPATGRVHVAIGEPGLVETVDPRTGKAMRTVTSAGAHTTVCWRRQTGST